MKLTDEIALKWIRAQTTSLIAGMESHYLSSRARGATVETAMESAHRWEMEQLQDRAPTNLSRLFRELR